MVSSFSTSTAPTFITVLLLTLAACTPEARVVTKLPCRSRHLYLSRQRLHRSWSEKSRSNACMRLRGGASVGSFEPATVKASLRAMADLYSLCGIGYWAAYKGILDVVTVRAMSKATYYIFLPALLFISVSRTLATPTHGGFAALAPLPIICAMQNFLGLALAKFALLPAAGTTGW